MGQSSVYLPRIQNSGPSRAVGEASAQQHLHQAITPDSIIVIVYVLQWIEFFATPLCQEKL